MGEIYSDRVFLILLDRQHTQSCYTDPLPPALPNQSHPEGCVHSYWGIVRLELGHGHHNNIGLPTFFRELGPKGAWGLLHR